jgi:hypothetical protein
MKDFVLTERKARVLFFSTGPGMLMILRPEDLDEDEPIADVLDSSRPLSNELEENAVFVTLTTKQCKLLDEQWNRERKSNTYAYDPSSGDEPAFSTAFDVEGEAVRIQYSSNIADELYFTLQRFIRAYKQHESTTLVLNEYELGNALVEAYQKHGNNSWLSVARDVISKFKVGK